MAGKLLDTNVYIALKASDPLLLETMASDPTVYTSSVVIGELVFGAYKSQKREENLKAVRDFAANITILPVTYETAFYYGQVREELRAKGKPIPENDIWIAAVALEHKLVLVTDDSHFNNVSKLQVESWKS